MFSNTGFSGLPGIPNISANGANQSSHTSQTPSSASPQHSMVFKDGFNAATPPAFGSLSNPFAHLTSQPTTFPTATSFGSTNSTTFGAPAAAPAYPVRKTARPRPRIPQSARPAQTPLLQDFGAVASIIPSTQPSGEDEMGRAVSDRDTKKSGEGICRSDEVAHFATGYEDASREGAQLLAEAAKMTVVEDNSQEVLHTSTVPVSSLVSPDPPISFTAPPNLVSGPLTNPPTFVDGYQSVTVEVIDVPQAAGPDVMAQRKARQVESRAQRQREKALQTQRDPTGVAIAAPGHTTSSHGAQRPLPAFSFLAPKPTTSGPQSQAPASGTQTGFNLNGLLGSIRGSVAPNDATTPAKSTSASQPTESLSNPVVFKSQDKPRQNIDNMFSLRNKPSPSAKEMFGTMSQQPTVSSKPADIKEVARTVPSDAQLADKEPVVPGTTSVKVEVPNKEIEMPASLPEQKTHVKVMTAPRTTLDPPGKVDIDAPSSAIKDVASPIASTSTKPQSSDAEKLDQMLKLITSLQSSMNQQRVDQVLAEETHKGLLAAMGRSMEASKQEHKAQMKALETQLIAHVDVKTSALYEVIEAQQKQIEELVRQLQRMDGVDKHVIEKKKQELAQAELALADHQHKLAARESALEKREEELETKRATQDAQDAQTKLALNERAQNIELDEAAMKKRLKDLEARQPATATEKVLVKEAPVEVAAKTQRVPVAPVHTQAKPVAKPTVVVSNPAVLPHTVQPLAKAVSADVKKGPSPQSEQLTPTPAPQALTEAKLQPSSTLSQQLKPADKVSNSLPTAQQHHATPLVSPTPTTSSFFDPPIRNSPYTTLYAKALTNLSQSSLPARSHDVQAQRLATLLSFETECRNISATDSHKSVTSWIPNWIIKNIEPLYSEPELWANFTYIERLSARVSAFQRVFRRQRHLEQAHQSLISLPRHAGEFGWSHRCIEAELRNDVGIFKNWHDALVELSEMMDYGEPAKYSLAWYAREEKIRLIDRLNYVADRGDWCVEENWELVDKEF